MSLTLLLVSSLLAVAVVGVRLVRIHRRLHRFSARGPQTCPICLDEMELDQLDRFPSLCGHYLHVECARPVIQLSNRCPLCRSALESCL